MDTPTPCRTLYIRNLPEKLKKARLRTLLHAAFTPYGRIVHLVAEKTLKLRGQAFITFDTLASSTTALRKMHGSQFLGRAMSVTYARQLSDPAASPKLGGDSTKSRSERQKDRQQNAASRNLQTGPISSAMPAVDEPPPVLLPPNNILFVDNLPSTVLQQGKPIQTAACLETLFAPFTGFVEVRSVPANDHIAFVEFADEAQSAVAMAALQGHGISEPPVPIKISFAKK